MCMHHVSFGSTGELETVRLCMLFPSFPRVFFLSPWMEDFLWSRTGGVSGFRLPIGSPLVIEEAVFAVKPAVDLASSIADNDIPIVESCN